MALAWAIFVDWEEWVGMNFTCDMNEDLVIGIGMKLYAWWILLYCLIMVGLWSVRNSLESIGEILWSCFSGRDVIPWPLLVGVHGGAPSI